MTRDDIIRKVREDDLQRAYERGYRAGIAAEREACAKVCEEQKRKYEERAAKPQNIRDISPEVARIAGIACDFDAAAIRARAL